MYPSFGCFPVASSQFNTPSFGAVAPAPFFPAAASPVGATFSGHFGAPFGSTFGHHHHRASLYTPAVASFPFGVAAPVAPPVAAPVTLATEEHLKIPSQQLAEGSTHDTCLSLVYWKIRGLASPIRMLLTFAGACYDETLITDGTEWFGDDEKTGLKKTLREENPFINLPFLEDGALVLSQSNTILRHLARKFNLFGCTEVTRAKSDMLLDQLADLRNSWSQTMYGSTPETFEDAKQNHLGVAAENFAKFTEWLELNGTGFLVENHATVADFVLWELIDVILALEPTILDSFPVIQEYHGRIRAEPRLAKYFDGETSKFQINGGSALFNQ